MSVLKDRKWQIIIGAVLVVLVVFTVILTLPKSKERKDKENEESKENRVLTEKDLKETYGFSGNDAIELIKKEYNDDNYEFTVNVNPQGLYYVSVKNKLTESEDKYLVDPATKAYYVLFDEQVETPQE